MKNRSADLIEWNDSLSDGLGCSGTRYKMSFDKHGRLPGEDAGPRWVVAVDGVMVCTATSIQDALARTESLEALRCILQGRLDLVSDQHWHGAEVMASEMAHAAADALARAAHGPDERGSLQQNLDALQALSSAIRAESLKRQREGGATPFPSLN